MKIKDLHWEPRSCFTDRMIHLYVGWNPRRLLQSLNTRARMHYWTWYRSMDPEGKWH